MPGFDGTGPRGMGRMSGRGLGYCGTSRVARGWPARSLGLRRGAMGPFGWGRGMGRGRGVFGAYWGPREFDSFAMPPQDEIDLLREQARQMETELRHIHDRLGELNPSDE
jgi:hypothetical protein